MSFVVINTRPLAQGSELNGLLKQSGIDVITCPLITIVPQLLDIKQKALLNNEATGKSIIHIFVSKNAVAHAKPYFNKSTLEGIAIAIGSGTFLSLEGLGFNRVIVSKPPFNSESLLNLDELQSVKNKTIFIWKGSIGRNKIKNVLTERDACLYDLSVYKQEKTSLASSIKNQLEQESRSFIIIVSSVLILETIQHNTFFKKKNSFLVCLSPRIAKQAKELSWSHCYITDNTDNESLHKTILKIVN